MKKLALALVCVFATSLPMIVAAQQPGASTPTIKRTVLQRVDVPGSPNYEAVTGIAEVPPNTTVGRHTHPGAETGYVIDGSMMLLIEGQAPMMLKAGDSYQIPVKAIHDVKTTDGGLKVMAVYIVEKGKPIASPAP